MELRVGVKILLKNKEGRYLILKRSPEKYSTVHKLWDMPGGRIEPGTTLLENLNRELQEETGISLQSEPRLIYAQDILRPDKHVVRLTFLGEGEGEIKLSDEHSEFTWLTAEEIKNKDDMDPYTQEVLNKAQL